MKKLKNKKGFTLIELIVVVAILGILALILVPSFMGYADDAKTAVNQANARNVWTSAKAAEGRSEYVDDLTPLSYIVTDTVDTAADSKGKFKGEVESKLGDAFTNLTRVTVANGKVTLAEYVNGDIACSFNGTIFDGECN